MPVQRLQLGAVVTATALHQLAMALQAEVVEDMEAVDSEVALDSEGAPVSVEATEAAVAVEVSEVDSAVDPGADSEVVLEVAPEAAAVLVVDLVADLAAVPEGASVLSKNTSTYMSHHQTLMRDQDQSVQSQLKPHKNTTRLSSSRPQVLQPQLLQLSHSNHKTKKRPSSTFWLRNQKMHQKFLSQLLPQLSQANQKYTSSNTRPKREPLAVESEVVSEEVLEVASVEDMEVASVEDMEAVSAVALEAASVAVTAVLVAAAASHRATVPQPKQEDHIKPNIFNDDVFPFLAEQRLSERCISKNEISETER